MKYLWTPWTTVAKRWSGWWWLIGITLLVAAVTQVYWGEKFPYTHDGENHLARFANYTIAVKEGQWPPRFAPFVFANYGFPVFHYNYPLANIVSVPFLLLKLHPEKVFAMLVTGFLLVGAGSWAFWLRQRFTRQASWWGVAQFLLSTYVLNLLFFRGNIGEVAAYSLFPLLLVLIDRRASNRKQTPWSIFLALVLAAFWLSHNIFAVFLTPFIFLYFLIAQPQLRVKDLSPWLLAGLLVSWFWLPALGELSLVVLQSDSLATQAADHLLTLTQILEPTRLGFGFSRPSPLDSLGLGLGLLSVVQIFLLLSRFIAKLPHRVSFSTQRSRELGLFAITAGATVFLAWEGSRLLWEHVRFLQLMQFPWRWLMVAILALIPLQSWLFDRLPRGLKLLLIVLMLFSLRQVFLLRPADFFHREAVSYQMFPGTTLTRDENRPTTLTSAPLPAWEMGPQALDGQIRSEIIRWRGSVHQYRLHVESDALIVEPTVYFPGWITKVDGQKVEQVFSDQTLGRVAFRLVQRTEPYEVTTVFGERTVWRWLGEGLTLIGLVGTTIWGGVVWHKRKR